ncbi:hypothetical protein H8356DRAFT_1654586 [Neocallimastix lanati (nom. inval.)]|nr:hypothetical protein H8356DRAFT_1654586 [Neocallimastix sp. JGI-2020a]
MVISSVQLNNYNQPIYSTSSGNIMHNLYIPSVCVGHSEFNNTQCSKTEVFECANDMNNEVSKEKLINNQHSYQRRIYYSTINRDVEELMNENTPFSEKLKETVEIIDEAYERYGVFGFSFNGGKDCTVLLHLLTAGLYRYAVRHPEIISPNEDLPKIPTVYIMNSFPFPEIDDYIKEANDLYDLDIISISEPMKEALKIFLDKIPEMKAISVGVRSTDPYSEHLQPFTPTDKGWPDFMRVLPILNWDYNDIWTFLLRLNVPYCCLYEQGYTSLGGTNNTIKNPALKIETDTGEEKYEPAYKLKDGSLERMGRIRKPASPSPLR